MTYAIGDLHGEVTLLKKLLALRDLQRSHAACKRCPLTQF